MAMRIDFGSRLCGCVEFVVVVVAVAAAVRCQGRHEEDAPASSRAFGDLCLRVVARFRNHSSCWLLAASGCGKP